MFSKRIDVRQIVPTSKISLKMSCLAACDNDIEKANRLYNYVADGLKDLPDFEPERISAFQRVSTSADEMLGWIGKHKEDFMQGWQMIQAMRGGTPYPLQQPVEPPLNVEPIPVNNEAS